MHVSSTRSRQSKDNSIDAKRYCTFTMGENEGPTDHGAGGRVCLLSGGFGGEEEGREVGEGRGATCVLPPLLNHC